MMKATKRLLHICSGFLLMATAAGAQATTMNVLVGPPGASIVAYDKVFYNWNIIHNLSSTTLVPLNNIDVTPIDSSTEPDPMNPGPGLRFTANQGALTVTGDGVYAYKDFSFGFTVTPTPLIPHVNIVDAQLDLDGYALVCTPGTTCTDLGVYIHEWVYTDATKATLLGEMTVQESFLNGVKDADILHDHINFGWQKSIYVEKNILVWAVDQGDIASLTGFSQRFSQVIPEPSSLMLFGIGFAALVRRRIL